jgi:hypothetical protein
MLCEKENLFDLKLTMTKPSLENLEQQEDQVFVFSSLKQLK